MKTKHILHSLMIAICVIAVTSCSYNNGDKSGESHELYRIYVGDKYGFMNEKGEIVIEPQFDMAFFYFSEGVCFAQMGGRSGLINENGEYIADLDKDISWVMQFSNGDAVCQTIDGKEGVINSSGATIVPAIYQQITADGESGYIVEDTNGNMGYINHKGEFIVPCKYDAVNGFNEGLMVVATSNKCGYVDTLGNWAIDTIYDDARAFGNGLARVSIDGRWTFIDQDNREALMNPEYTDILTGFADNRAFVKYNDAIWLIDKKGRKLKRIEADTIYGFREGFATFVKNGRRGKLDTNGVVAIQAKYERLGGVTGGYASFRQNGKFGIIDMTGKVIIDAVHNYNATMMNGLLFGQDSINGEWPITYYDRKGNVIWKDMPNNKFSWPTRPTKEDFKAYFDSKLSELDPIEGLYYVTFNYIAVDRDNDHQSSNGSKTGFYAVIRRPNTDEYLAYVADKDKSPYSTWVKKFVQIGESNAYAIVNSGENTQWSEDGKLILDDPYKFELTLRTGGNNWYNWYVNCEFIKSYPSAAEYEQVQKAEWSGSGFAIADGYIVTNNHVVNGAKSISVKGINGDEKTSYKGYVVASDRQHDIAIIKIVDKKFKGFETIPYCIGKTIPEMGDEVFVLGYPLTTTMGEEVKLTNGIISATTGFKGDESMYQITSALQPGNSGGPLFDNDGNVIGIVCAKHADAENANYAIKVSYLYSLINSSGLGISLSDNNKVKGKSLSKKVRQVKPFVYLLECNSH